MTNISYPITSQVILKTDIEKNVRIVTAYKVSVAEITYEVSCGTQVSWHYDFEMVPFESMEKPPAGFGQ